MGNSGNYLSLIIPKKKNLVVERRLATSGNIITCGLDEMINIANGNHNLGQKDRRNKSFILKSLSN